MPLPQKFEIVRRRIRDALPTPLGFCLTRRANPMLGLAFLLLRRRFRVEGMSFEVPLRRQPWSALATYWFDDYERPERTLCCRHIQPSDRVCELGGCLGVVSMVINRRLSRPESHLVVEANPEMLRFLERNRQRNRGRFRLIHAAVSMDPTVELQPGAGPLFTSVRKSDGRAGSSLPSITLEHLWRDNGPFDVLVMDIEGAEESVILHGRDALRSCRLVIVEWHPERISHETVERCRLALADAGLHRIETIHREPCDVDAWKRAPAQ